ncbi:hypothetical protein [Nocardia amikacinitolerans]|uniref:hypothetical protein n=1 Tax=Nocardia amikacinitolerans TaxID=756689 RepID=UPI0020A44EF8|nr:hypothetical protein [Nocardia amikacinitolerans]MCP2277680.1 Mce-associated membrane protein [Nocardia amikacinitolerans]
MNTRRPVNRVTPKRRTAQPAARPTRRPKVTSARPTASRDVPTREKQSAAAERRPRRFTPPRLRSARSWAPVATALVAAVLLAGFAVVAAQRPGVPDENQAFLDTSATEEVRAAADHALRTIYGYDIEHIDDYEAAVRQVVTGEMLADLDEFAATTIDAIRQARTSADAKADPIGVTMLTEDRAELLVNLVVSATKDGVAQQSVAGPVVLRMQKVDGRWLAGGIVDQ